MELIRGLHNLASRHRGCVATIGNFDGVHLGHQAVIGQLADEAARLHLPSVLITFEPQPQEYFAQAQVPARLTRFREKLEQLRRFALDRIVCLPFTARLAAMPAEAFIQRVLIDGLGVRYLVVGDDFRFGQGRQGDFALLQETGATQGFDVVNMHTFTIDGGRVSSTRIRTALEQGELQSAQRLLGRDYRMSGRVAHGDKRGRTIGFPTANIHLHRRVSPVQGVYAVEMYGVAGEPLQGVANIGNRPTVDGTRTVLEVYLLDFRGDLYGRHVQVSFAHKLRAEMHFASLDALRMQIDRDVAQARAYFAR